MKKLIIFLFCLAIFSGLAYAQKGTGRVKLSGRIKAAGTGGGGGGTQAIIFNGTSQDGYIDLPNASPFTSIGQFQIVGRMRVVDTGGGKKLLEIRNSSQTLQFDFTTVNATTLSVFDARDSIQMFPQPTDMADFVFKIQYDPLNATPRWTVETWKFDGTGYTSNTVNLVTSTNWNWGGGRFAFASTYYEDTRSPGHFDFTRWISRVEALSSSGCPSNAAPTGVTYFADYRFEGNATDSSAVAGNLTLTGTPTYETTSPVQTCP